ncbi:MAG TPA: PEP-CTERM sorting domain-containing protein [Lacipirellulaceae bacterium]|nr:PEP-CTERM sorting domain-containing protein [Lacipirellulaceae bacterium]
MRITLALASVVLIATPAAAGEPQPVATLTWRQPQPVTLPAEYSVFFRMFSYDITVAGWRETVSSFPHHSFADEATVNSFNAELFTANAIYQFNGELRFFHGEQTDFPCGWCQLHWAIGEGHDQFLAEKAADGWSGEMLAPSRGPNLVGYILTGIERTVTATSQTITLHGVPVPEPASWLLACLALCCARRHR